jgi:hypothetical protein
MSNTGWIGINIHFLKEWHPRDAIIAVETAQLLVPTTNPLAHGNVKRGIKKN